MQVAIKELEEHIQESLKIKDQLSNAVRDANIDLIRTYQTHGGDIESYANQ